MQTFTAGQANTIFADVVTRAAPLAPIIIGTVNFYLVALDGANAGKWFKTSNNSWSATEDIAAVSTHKADGHWTASVDAEAWTTSVKYMFYWKESGDLHLPVSEQIFEASVLVKALAQAALAQFATDDTGESGVVSGSVAALARGGNPTPSVFGGVFG
jgi:hypothetical protein